MYYYAILDHRNICRTVIECTEQKNDIGENIIELDSNNLELLDRPWNGSEWVAFDEDPEKTYWNGSEWTKQPIPKLSEDEQLLQDLGTSILQEMLDSGAPKSEETIQSAIQTSKQRFLELKGYEFVHNK